MAYFKFKYLLYENNVLPENKLSERVLFFGEGMGDVGTNNIFFSVLWSYLTHVHLSASKD